MPRKDHKDGIINNFVAEGELESGCVDACSLGSFNSKENASSYGTACMFMNMAQLVAKRSPLPAAERVGCIIVNKSNKIMGMGYNYQYLKPNEDDGDSTKMIEAPALGNAIAQLSLAESDDEELHIFITRAPCPVQLDYLDHLKVVCLIYWEDTKCYFDLEPDEIAFSVEEGMFHCCGYMFVHFDSVFTGDSSMHNCGVPIRKPIAVCKEDVLHGAIRDADLNFKNNELRDRKRLLIELFFVLKVHVSEVVPALHHLFDRLERVVLKEEMTPVRRVGLKRKLFEEEMEDYLNLI